MKTKTHLEVLHTLDARIEARSCATSETHAFWPCAKGCDDCCRSLPHLPNVTRAEWERLRHALATLPDAEAVRAIIRRGGETRSGKTVCPLLDQVAGACRVYEARPISCRTYGYYTEWDAGLHCDKVTRAVREHEADGAVTWGNGEAIAQDLRALGETKRIDAWLRDDDGTSMYAL